MVWQELKHADATSKVQNKEPPTLSRLGRNVVVMLSAIYHWLLFAADVKSAFL